MAGQKYSKIMKLMKSQFFFSSFGVRRVVLVSLVQIKCQNFMSELEEMCAAQRYWLVLSALGGPACSESPHGKFAYQLDVLLPLSMEFELYHH